MAMIEQGDPGGCWPWRGSLRRSQDGYGQINRGGRLGPVLAHRAAWEILVGPIPEGMWVLHRCDNPPCCNPAHLFLGTNADNMADMARKGRWNAPHGERHPWSKLTADQVHVMRGMRRGGLSNSDIAWLLRVSKHAVDAVLCGHSWRRV